tara:strand:- start:4164 stop:4379 length:216 start_codon:yes stop_codon:yes gene_type:complete
MTNYFLIGLVFGIFIEILYSSLKSKHMLPYKPGQDPYNWWIRVAIVILWPICLIVFLIGFCRTYFKKNEKK